MCQIEKPVPLYVPSKIIFENNCVLEAVNKTAQFRTQALIAQGMPASLSDRETTMIGWFGKLAVKRRFYTG